METLKVLLLEDNALDAELLLRQMRLAGYEIEAARVENSADLKTKLTESEWDLVVSDYNLPSFSGLDALMMVREIKPTLPFLLVSGNVGEEIAVETLKRGADDIIMKSNLGRLGVSITRCLRERRSAALAERAQRHREQILAVISHDLRNPLCAMDLKLESLRLGLERGDVPKEKILNEFDSAQSLIHRMTGILEAVLEQTRLENGQVDLSIQTHSLRDLANGLKESFEPIMKDKGLGFSVHVEGEDEGRYDSPRLQQAIGNLLGNAHRYTPTGGAVELRFEATSNEIKIGVHDNGPGISEDNQQLIFMPFWKGENKTRDSLGLGLSIVRGIIQAHGGRISVKSKVGEGAHFEMLIPNGAYSTLQTTEEDTNSSYKPRESFATH